MLLLALLLLVVVVVGVISVIAIVVVVVVVVVVIERPARALLCRAFRNESNVFFWKQKKKTTSSI